MLEFLIIFMLYLILSFHFGFHILSCTYDYSNLYGIIYNAELYNNIFTGI